MEKTGRAFEPRARAYMTGVSSSCLLPGSLQRLHVLKYSSLADCLLTFLPLDDAGKDKASFM